MQTEAFNNKKRSHEAQWFIEPWWIMEGKHCWMAETAISTNEMSSPPSNMKCIKNTWESINTVTVEFVKISTTKTHERHRNFIQIWLIWFSQIHFEGDVIFCLEYVQWLFFLFHFFCLFLEEVVWQWWRRRWAAERFRFWLPITLRSKFRENLWFSLLTKRKLKKKKSKLIFCCRIVVCKVVFFRGDVVLGDNRWLMCSLNLRT